MLKNLTKKIVFLMLIAAFVFAITTCASQSSSAGTAPQTGVILEKRVLTLTLGASEKLNYTLTPEASNQRLVWASSDSRIVSVSNDGTVTANNYATGGNARANSSPATGTAVITVKTADGQFEDAITVTATTQAFVDIMALPPIKDQFSPYFMIGNIFNPGDVGSSGVTNQRLIRHYNILTPENAMKPDTLSPGRGTYNFATSNRMVNAAIASGFKVHGHTLLWHQQNAGWMTSMARANKETALAAMKRYITDVVTHFKGRVYSWDVLNEVFPDSVGQYNDWQDEMRPENPWYASIGSDFVYEGFLAARLADPDAILFYNDFNTDSYPKATMIHNMVRDVNQRYLTSGDKPAGEARDRLLIEVIGMQEHHNIDISMSSISRTINQFRPLGVKIAVTELDVLAQSWGEYSARTPVTNEGIYNQSLAYGEYFELYLENADIIERVSIWGVTDNQSWRSFGLPLLFSSQGKAKPAYYMVIQALGSI